MVTFQDAYTGNLLQAIALGQFRHAFSDWFSIHISPEHLPSRIRIPLLDGVVVRGRGCGESGGYSKLPEGIL